MREVEVVVPAGFPKVLVIGLVEVWCAVEGLQMTQKSSLARYPGCTHWHYQRPGQSGTLEITWWPERGRLWFPMRTGRSKQWVEAAVLKLKGKIEEGMRQA